MAAWLTDHGRQPRTVSSADDWDLLHLSHCDAHDTVTLRLAQELESLGSPLHHRPASRCWRIALPLDWAQYEAALSKSHRKQLRRVTRKMLQSGRAVLHTTATADDLPRALAILVDLHQQRRRMLGQRGCFAAPRFAAFHEDVLLPMFQQGQCELHWLELDGRPVAAEYHLMGNGNAYAYQSGMAAASLRYEPGRLLSVALLQRAIALGYIGGHSRGRASICS
jgi:CelD/BcsL family acetyltransferase involved in cellulose biosynthesis